MRDMNKMIEHIEQTTWGSRDRRSSQPADKPKPSSHAWRAPDAVLRPASPAEREAHRRFEGAANALVARAVKVTVPLDPAAVAALEVREGGPPRLRLTIAVEGGVLQADVAAKAVRKAQRTLVENSPDAIFCQLIGKLVKNEIVECGTGRTSEDWVQVTTRTEKIRKLRALGRSPNPHEAASALEMARKLEARAITAKGAALAIASLFEARGLTVRVRRHNAPWAGQGERRAFNVEISYRVSKAKVFRPRRDLKIDIVEFGA